MGRMVRAAVFVLLMPGTFVAPEAALAQDGAVSGTVTDTTGLVLPGVTVEARGASGGPVLTAATDGAGAFAVGGLDAGVYELTFTLPGFQTVVRGGVAVGAGAAATVDVEMAVELAERVVVLGSRAQPRSVTESQVPIDAIPFEDVMSQGATTLDYQLRNLIPSFNVATHPISDAATLVRPASLRNLSHDHTLILVNGKRRHRSSVVAWFGGVTDGAQGPDISTIPSIALRQVEVLRDGASAQYGSDAIAGVINFLLKDDPSGGSLELNTGTYRPGDGDSYSLAGNVGLPLGETGFANLSLEYGNANPTDRSVQRLDAADLAAAGNTHVRDPAQVWGNPRIEDDLKLFGNFGHLFANRVQVYGYANYADKKVTEGFFFRNPNSRQSIYSLDGGQTLLIGDVLQARGLGSANCPVVRVSDNVPDPDALARVFADPDCFSFQEIAPGGFTPQFGGVVTDQSVVAGVRRIADGGFTWDASAGYGAHQSDFFFRNTVNASLGPDTPRDFDPGLYRQEDVNLNFDVSYPVSDRVNVAAGAEWRDESFETGAGGRPLVGGRPLRGAGLRPRLERLPRLPRLHRRRLDPQQRRRLRRPRAAGARRPVGRRRRRPGRALRRLRQHHQRQALVPLRPGRRRLGARRRQHRVPRPHAGPAERPERADDHRPRDPRARRQRHRAVDLPGRGSAGRQAPRAREVVQRHRRPRRRHRPVHPDRRLLPGSTSTTGSRCRSSSR